MNKAARAYVVEFGGAMLAYAIVVVISEAILRANPHAGWRALVAITPMIPAVFALLAFVRFLGRMDELQQRIQLTALGIGFGGTAILTFAYGFLEQAGFPVRSMFWVLPVMLFLWGIGGGVATLRYQ